MTDTKHTPGPWKVGRYGGVYPVNGDKYGGPAIMSALTPSGNLPNAKANETLCAAAPDMYEALDAAETMLRCLPNTTTNANGTKPTMTTERSLTVVRDAIAKATGDA